MPSNNHSLVVWQCVHDYGFWVKRSLGRTPQTKNHIYLQRKSRHQGLPEDTTNKYISKAHAKTNIFQKLLPANTYRRHANLSSRRHSPQVSPEDSQNQSFRRVLISRGGALKAPSSRRHPFQMSPEYAQKLTFSSRHSLHMTICLPTDT